MRGMQGFIITVTIFALWIVGGAIIWTVRSINLERDKDAQASFEVEWETSKNLGLSIFWPILLIFSPIIGVAFLASRLVRKIYSSKENKE